MDLICTQGCSVINSEGGPPCGFLILSRGVIWQNMNSGDTEYDKMWAPGMIILAENRINQDENLSPVRRCAILVLMDSNCMNLRNIRYVIDVLHWIWMEPLIPEGIIAEIQFADSEDPGSRSGSWCLYAWITLSCKVRSEIQRKQRQITNSSRVYYCNSFILLANPPDHSGFVEEDSYQDWDLETVSSLSPVN